MSIAKVIVPVTGVDRDAGALAAAFAAARPFNAHVAALLVHPDPRMVVPFTSAPLRPDIVQNMIDTAAELNVIATKAVRATLADTAKKVGAAVVDCPIRTNAITCSFVEMEGSYAGSISRVARLSDLVVFGAIAASDGADVNECFVEILTRTDRPVLVSGNLESRLTRNIAVAWDGSGAACHAITGALPFLQRAETVTILHIGEALKYSEERYSSRTNLGELKEYLGLHGIGASVRNFDHSTKSTGEALLDAATSVEADLLVMGGYGHSHLRETIFGGVTAHIRSHAALPVLMVH